MPEESSLYFQGQTEKLYHAEETYHTVHHNLRQPAEANAEIRWRIYNLQVELANAHAGWRKTIEKILQNSRRFDYLEEVLANAREYKAGLESIMVQTRAHAAQIESHSEGKLSQEIVEAQKTEIHAPNRWT